MDVSVAFIEGDLEGFNTTLLDLVEVAFCVVLVPWVVAVVGSPVEEAVVGAGCHGASFPVHGVPLAEILIPSGHRHVWFLAGSAANRQRWLHPPLSTSQGLVAEETPQNDGYHSSQSKPMITQCVISRHGSEISYAMFL